MTTAPVAQLQPRAMTIAGWVLSGLFLAFMVMDVGMKLLRLPIVETTGRQLHLPTVGKAEDVMVDVPDPRLTGDRHRRTRRLGRGRGRGEQREDERPPTMRHAGRTREAAVRLSLDAR